VTEPVPTSAFRRFPWIQLVFCIACLTMTGWTWMRFSYCWKMGAASLVKYGYRSRLDQDTTLLAPSAYDASRMDNRYVELSGHMTPRPVTSRFEKGNWQATFYVAEDYVLANLEARGNLVEGQFEMKGRLHFGHHGEYTFFDTTASRFHSASLAALVVGAMGVFIFGLYLRAWLRERKALASGPPQDMIA
jgi:hypothetical protein